MQLKGKVTHKSEIQIVGKKQMEKQFIVVKETEHEEDYKNNALAIDFLWEKVQLLDNIQENDIVTVEYNTNTNEYNGKYYNSIRGWKIEKHWESKTDTEDNEWDLPFK